MGWGTGKEPGWRPWEVGTGIPEKAGGSRWRRKENKVGTKGKPDLGRAGVAKSSPASGWLVGLLPGVGPAWERESGVRGRDGV